MRTAYDKYQQVVAMVPPHIKQEVDMEMALSCRIEDLMKKRGLNKAGLASALGKRPCEVTKWLSGQHNFTIKTIAMLSAFFGESLMIVK
ncbi:MAG: helix-turn-helix transcriptional regulator [Bacteroidaceae bacterium]|nr:helix-turn-helix transcriptional regulator [Bacteroidaceae bacterium]